MGGRGGGASTVQAVPAPAQATQVAPAAFSVAEAMSAIGQAYRELTTGPRDWVSLTDLRPRLDSRFDRRTVDQALIRINATKGNNVVGQSNQKILTERDRAAMVRIGGDPKLLISMSNFEVG